MNDSWKSSRCWQGQSSMASPGWSQGFLIHIPLPPAHTSSCPSNYPTAMGEQTARIRRKGPQCHLNSELCVDRNTSGEVGAPVPYSPFLTKCHLQAQKSLFQFQFPAESPGVFRFEAMIRSRKHKTLIIECSLQRAKEQQEWSKTGKINISGTH